MEVPVKLISFKRHRFPADVIRQAVWLYYRFTLSLLKLPPYSPQINPAENIWQYLRQNQLSNRVYDDYDAIVDACCEAWNKLTAEPGRIASIATRDWALQVNG